MGQGAGAGSAPAMVRLTDLLRSAWGLPSPELTPASRGADRDTFLCHVRDASGTRYLARLRRGPLNRAALRLPQFMRARGEPAFLAPLPARNGALFLTTPAGALTLHPRIDGLDGFARPLNAPAWRQLGRALRALHEADLPPDLRADLPRETFTAASCTALRRIMASHPGVAADPLQQQMHDLLRHQRPALDWLLRQTATLAPSLRARSLPLHPCHGDLHAGNVLVDARGQLHLIDWDTLLLAPRERDLMFIGAGVAGRWQGTGEAAWFYAGYGAWQPDASAIAFYRCERIVADLVDYCGQITDAAAGHDRTTALAELRRQLAPGPELRIARRTVAALPP